MSLQCCSFVILLAMSFAEAVTLAKRYNVSKQFPRAMCMDGSPSVYYLREAPVHSKNANRWIVSLQGGASCSVSPLPQDGPLDTRAATSFNCQHRLETPMASSLRDPPEMQLDYKEVLARDAKINPVFHDWNVAFARYCDGTAWSSDEDVAPDFNGTDCPRHFQTPHGNCTVYHWRGRANLEGIVGSLIEEHGMRDASQVVLHGVSSGALGAAVGGNMVRAALPETVSFALLLDSAYAFGEHFPFEAHDEEEHVKSFEQRIQRELPYFKQNIRLAGRHLWNYEREPRLSPKYIKAFAALKNHVRPCAGSGWSCLANSSIADNSKECVEFLANELKLKPTVAQSECFKAEYSIAFSSLPTFILGSLFDSWALHSNAEAVAKDCAKTQECIDKWNKEGRNREALLKWSFSKRRERLPGVPLGAFLDHCPHHGMKWHQLWDNAGNSNAYHVDKWLEAVRVWHLSELGKGGLSDNVVETANRIVYQRPGAKFPCFACCYPLHTEEM